jgi:prevent-host-death family protein
MKSVGAYEAKTHLSQLLSEVEHGERIAITKHGHTVAMLVPVGEVDSVVEAIASIRQNRKGVKIGRDLSIAEMKKEGRK